MHPSQLFSSAVKYTRHSARVEVAMPGLMPEQQAQYESYVRDIITRLAGFLDLTMLAGVKFQPKLSEGLKAFDKNNCEVPSSAVCVAVGVPEVGDADEIIIVADLHHFLGFFDPDHPDHLNSLQSFGHALGHVHAASKLRKVFADFNYAGRFDTNWSEATTECYREYLASFYTHAIGTDPLDSRCKRLEETFNAANAGGAEIAEMVATGGYSFEDMVHALFEYYREFFLAASSLLGSLSAKGQTMAMLDPSRLRVPEGVLTWMELYRIRLLILGQAIALDKHVDAAFYNFGMELKSSLYALEIARNPEVAEETMDMDNDYSSDGLSVYGYSFLPNK